MKAILLPASILLVFANGYLLLWSPTTDALTLIVLGIPLALSVLVAVAAFASRRRAPAAPIPSPAPPPPAAPENAAQAEVLTLLAVLQERGRLVDFLMDDITAYEDAQVGAAARVVHQGCRTALTEHFDIASIAAEAQEGASITVPADHAPDAYRLTGNIQGDPPFTGTLVHKGWKANSVRLPRLLHPDADTLPVIAPAEVELK
ncbi:hypothetical protein BH23VER1_BH23VER1_17810 [soil metagenome]